MQQHNVISRAGVPACGRFATAVLGIAFALVVVGGAAPTPGPVDTLPLRVQPVVSSPASAGTNPSVKTHPLTAEDLDAFFDGLIPDGMKRGDIAGTVVVVVKDGKILLSRGYGYADVARREPVVPERTLFREASITKTFTWTAVMQLVQAGKIDLDRDVNDYLDFRIPAKFGKPITMRNLMTHTAGFEETGADLEFWAPGHLTSLRAYLINHMPAQIFAPGTVTAYSNYGGALAGYIVQRLSGEPYGNYIADHIFKPLGMMHSSVAQPLPPALAADLAKGYMRASDPNLIPFEYIQTAPSSTLSATGTDMAHFMIAQLENGSYQGTSILSPAMIALMHSPQSRMAPGINGFDLGFMQQDRNGLRIIGHGGDMMAFHSDMELLLDKNVGIFVSFNSGGKQGGAGTLRTAIVDAFLDRYFPRTPPADRSVSNSRADAARVAGWYQASRRSETALLLMPMLGESDVMAFPDGTIEIDILRNLAGDPIRWQEVGPLLYRDADGSRLKFVTDDRGRVLYWAADEMTPQIFQRVHGFYAYSTFRLLGIVCVAIWLGTILIWFGGWLSRRHYGVALQWPADAAGLRLASRLGAVALLTMMSGWTVLFTSLGLTMLTNPGFFRNALTVVYVLSALAVLGALAILAEAGRRVALGPGGFLVRTGECLSGLSALYAIWLIFAFGLANFSFRY